MEAKRSVRFTYSARGPRAWRWARGRWWTTGVEEARLAVATGAAKDVTADYVATDTPWGRRFHYQKPAEAPAAPSAFGTSGHGCVGHRTGGATVRCPEDAIVPTYGAKCAACGRAQVAASRAAFARDLAARKE